MWPTEKTSRPTDSALLSVYKLNIWRSEIGPARWNGPVWEVWMGRKGNVLNLRWLGVMTRQDLPLQYKLFRKVGMLQEKFHTWHLLLLLSSLSPQTHDVAFIHVRKCSSNERTNFCFPQLGLQKKESLFLWVSPHTVLSKQICNPACRSWALSFMFGLMGEPHKLSSLYPFPAQKYLKGSKFRSQVFDTCHSPQWVFPSWCSLDTSWSHYTCVVPTRTMYMLPVPYLSSAVSLP